MSYFTIILGLFLVVYIVYNMIYVYTEIAYVTADLDGKTYMIRRGNNRTATFFKESANALATINQRMEKLISHLDKNYSSDSSKNYFIKKLKQNYNPYMISEAAVDPRYTTYTIDKQNMHICLRTRNAEEKVYDMNTLMYVVLHESAHLANYSPDGSAIIGHGSEFKMVFKFLVEQSIKLGLYNYVDYANIPREYCGIVINSNILN
jgi:hypothetical protein